MGKMMLPEGFSRGGRVDWLSTSKSDQELNGATLGLAYGN